MSKNTYEKTKRDTGWLSFLLGEGQEIENTQNNLNALTETYNKIFEKLGPDENMLKEKLNQVINIEKNDTLHFKVELDYFFRNNKKENRFNDVISNESLSLVINHW